MENKSASLSKYRTMAAPSRVTVTFGARRPRVPLAAIRTIYAPAVATAATSGLNSTTLFAIGRMLQNSTASACFTNPL